jgi:TRAP-type mannitol/chloroaromatic compound transport system permease small subunit
MTLTLACTIVLIYITIGYFVAKWLVQKTSTNVGKLIQADSIYFVLVVMFYPVILAICLAALIFVLLFCGNNTRRRK